MRRVLVFFGLLCMGALIVHQDGVSYFSGTMWIPTGEQITFEEPIDGLSIGVTSDSIDLKVSAFTTQGWTEWDILELEKEFDPLLRESSMVLFPDPVQLIRIGGTTEEYEVHPIRISSEPAKVELAAITRLNIPRVLSRTQWGADESYLYSGTDNTRSDVVSDTANRTPTAREIECEQAKRLYPHQFQTAKTITHNAEGKRYRWALRYSNDVDLLVVHHTALNVTGDVRSGIERMRALYTYHANNRGWGDVGYHYIIDETGQIYEGRDGGKNVVGGHVYCGNVGTIGVALMGNFDEEKPTQDQMKSLQWLLADLAEQYDINLNRNVSFHGKNTSPIVRHRDLISTICPGYYVSNTISQIRRNVIAGNVDTPISFPVLAKDGYQNRTASRLAERLSTTISSVFSRSQVRTGLSAIGSTSVTGRPGGEVSVQLRYTAGSTPERRRARIGDVVRSNNRIGIWQTISGTEFRVRNDVLLPEDVSANNTTTIKLRIQLPRDGGVYSVDIGPITYTLNAEGRRIRTPVSEPVQQSYNPADSLNTQTPGYRRNGSTPTITNVQRTVTSVSSDDGDNIRIRLSYPYQTARVTADGAASIAGGTLPTGTEIRFGKDGNNCSALRDNAVIDSGVPRFDAGDSITTIESWDSNLNRFRGIIECRIVDGELVLINELPLEQYMRGLAEEPDTEPFEKQKAFAIAARSYAAFYMQPNERKFPGKPYDGDDSPARFQKYGGVGFEERNAAWVRAVDATSNKVLMKDGDIIKAAYFSSDDGRTRSPAENGWASFPHAEVFVSKSDPWCEGMELRGHGVGMSGCGAKGQANQGRTMSQILYYYYTDTEITDIP